MVIYIINGDNNFCLWGTCTSCKVLHSHRIKHAFCSKSLANIIYDMGLLFALFSIFKPLYLFRRSWHVFFCIVFFPPSFPNFVRLLIRINNFNIIKKRWRKPTGVKKKNLMISTEQSNCGSASFSVETFWHLIPSWTTTYCLVGLCFGLKHSLWQT